MPRRDGARPAPGAKLLVCLG